MQRCIARHAAPRFQRARISAFRRRFVNHGAARPDVVAVLLWLLATASAAAHCGPGDCHDVPPDPGDDPPQAALAAALESGIARGAVEQRSYLSYATESLDNLIQFGTDRYGPVQSSLFVSVLDVRTKATVIPEFGDTNWRADGRFGRRSPQGANFLQTQPLIRALYRATDITGDTDYARLADVNIDYATNNLVDSNGMFHWGWHRWYDVVTDQFMDIGDVHELHYVTTPAWEAMWSQNPVAVQTEIERIWERHVVDPSTGEINRHDDAQPGVSFIMSSASFVEALAFLSSKAPGPIPGETNPEVDTWLERAKRVADYPWNGRNPTTNLTPHIPDKPNSPREDEEVAFTTMHLLARGLLKSYEHTGDAQFLDQALAYLTAYDTYGYDAQAETYWGTIALDGTPDTSPRSGPLAAFPTGHIDFWQPNAIDREFPAEAAQAYADALALTGDATMRTAADRWAKVIRNTMATKETLNVSIYSGYSQSWAPLGTYAEHYARTIDFFVTLYEETGEQHYLYSARDLAKDAVSSLYFEGLFRGHPNKPYYEELDGVPLLIESLLELDQHAASFQKFGDFDGDNDVDRNDYQFLLSHWLQEIAPYENGDVTGDGVVNLLDFQRFKNEYFEGNPVIFLQVPEPAALGLLLIGAGVAWARRPSRTARAISLLRPGSAIDDSAKHRPASLPSRLLRASLFGGSLATLLFTVVASHASPARAGEWRSYVVECLDTLIERGADVYGPVHSPMLMSVIDVRTLTAPRDPDDYDRLIRLEGRIHRRGEGGSDLWNDQPTLRAMYLASEATSDRKYADAADAYIRFALANCRKPNGLLVWGSHIFWDCYEERAAGDRNGAGPHEILVHQCHWGDLYRNNAEAVRDEIDAIWKWHVHDHDTGRHNRHDDGKPGADFPFSGGSFLEAFAFLHSVTPGDVEYLNRAKLVADWHWRHRHPETNLVAFQPGNLLLGIAAYEFYGSTFASAITGPHAANLLRSYELTGDPYFRDAAVGYLLAYDEYGWQEEEQTFVGMLNLDGAVTTADDAPDEYLSQLPNQEREPDPGYSVPPIGPVDIWPTTIYPIDYPLLTAQAAMYAYELTPKSDLATRAGLLRMAKRWAIAIQRAMPPQVGRTFRQTVLRAMPDAERKGGTYAANYGRAISFFVHLYRATGDEHYLELASTLARDAVDKLYVQTQIADRHGQTRQYGIFRGHAAKPYYEAVDGVGFLLLALLDLDDPDQPAAAAF